MAHTEYLSSVGCLNVSGISVDVEDLFYSLPHDVMMRRTRDCITNDNDELAFVNRSGIPVEAFLELLSFYLQSTVVGFEDKVYVQKSGVCIGSKVAPVLSNIFLGKVDCDLQLALQGVATKVFRYVDDFLVLGCNVQIESFQCAVLDAFNAKGKGLKFTAEVPVEGTLKFLDLELRFEAASYMLDVRAPF